MGVPGAIGAVYLTKIGLACAVVTGPTAKQFAGGVPGEPTTGAWTTGCNWTMGGDFRFTVEHKRGFRDSIDEATRWYGSVQNEAAQRRSTARTRGARATWPTWRARPRWRRRARPGPTR
ncbi:hypothetical protein [Dactylosporangium sp. CA-139066]|uniref:hypothetical protein n=1 Tax=Dactylosporangium sp. CA-139066 TaxID=3239930 RepID=UPI003D945CEA